MIIISFLLFDEFLIFFLKKKNQFWQDKNKSINSLMYWIPKDSNISKLDYISNLNFFPWFIVNYKNLQFFFSQKEC